MKRQHTSIDSEEEMDNDTLMHLHPHSHFPRDVYNEIVSFIRPKLALSLNLVNYENVNIETTNFREYIITISMDDVIKVDLRFGVEICSHSSVTAGDGDGPRNNNDDVVFMYGDNSSDEFSYNTIIGYSFDDINALLNTVIDETVEFPPLMSLLADGILHINSDYLVSHCNIRRIDQTSLVEFKHQFDQMYQWILNKVI